MSERMHPHIPPAEAPARDSATPRPCPFCGASDPAIDRNVYEELNGVECLECGAKIVRDGTDGEAIAAWNCRAVNAHDALMAALSEVMGWIGNWSPNFEQDEEWPATAEKARAALALTEGDAS